MTGVEQVTAPLADHGEGPVWHDGWGGLRWVDMLAGDILALDSATGEVRRHHVGDVVAALRPRATGGAVLALERGFALLDAAGLEAGLPLRPLGEIWPDPAVRFNDGGCDPQGRFYCGSMASDAAPGRGALYRLDADGSVTTVLTGVGVSNGLAWSADGTTAYYVDTATQCVDAFDYDQVAGLTARRTLVRVDDADGAPDGLTVDADGHLWVALWGGSAVRRYAPSGRLDGVVELPVSQVTACTFGGPGLAVLYVTTSRQGIDPATQPASGALFRADVGVGGLPVLTYGG
ncbi:MAG: SMP-30/gluconolactonase/LRE family protein [Propionibacteriales bacterium]|nr:SMP-30/gluconolactonase/LRE family protein [Propionibacteriales bacterium]